MARFKEIPVVVEAVPYEPERGLEDGIDELTLKQAEELKIEHVVMDWYSGAVTGSQGVWRIPFLNMPDGRRYISPGDMIVTETDGYRFAFNKKAFESIFQPAPNAALTCEMKEAEKQLQQLERQYAAIGRFIPPMKALIGGLRERLDAGESTQQLYKEIMDARISA